MRLYLALSTIFLLVLLGIYLALFPPSNQDRVEMTPPALSLKPSGEAVVQASPSRDRISARLSEREFAQNMADSKQIIENEISELIKAYPELDHPENLLKCDVPKCEIRIHVDPKDEKTRTEVSARLGTILRTNFYDESHGIHKGHTTSDRETIGLDLDYWKDLKTKQSWTKEDEQNTKTGAGRTEVSKEGFVKHADENTANNLDEAAIAYALDEAKNQGNISDEYQFSSKCSAEGPCLVSLTFPKDTTAENISDRYQEILVFLMEATKQVGRNIPAFNIEGSVPGKGLTIKPKPQ